MKLATPDLRKLCAMTKCCYDDSSSKAVNVEVLRLKFMAILKAAGIATTGSETAASSAAAAPTALSALVAELSVKIGEHDLRIEDLRVKTMKTTFGIIRRIEGLEALRVESEAEEAEEEEAEEEEAEEEVAEEPEKVLKETVEWTRADHTALRTLEAAKECDALDDEEESALLQLRCRKMRADGSSSSQGGGASDDESYGKVDESAEILSAAGASSSAHAAGASSSAHAADASSSAPAADAASLAPAADAVRTRTLQERIERKVWAMQQDAERPEDASLYFAFWQFNAAVGRAVLRRDAWLMDSDAEGPYSEHHYSSKSDSEEPNSLLFDSEEPDSVEKPAEKETLESRCARMQAAGSSSEQGGDSDHESFGLQDTPALDTTRRHQMMWPRRLLRHVRRLDGTMCSRRGA